MPSLQILSIQRSFHSTARLALTAADPFVSYHFGDGWSVGSSPEITTNWIASGEKWTVPVGGGVGKTFRVDGQVVKVDLNGYYNAIRPQAGNETWLIQLKLTFVFPN